MIRFEVGCHQSAEVHHEKKSIYEPTVNCFKLKYALIHVELRKMKSLSLNASMTSAYEIRPYYFKYPWRVSNHITGG
ncbi:hypothetical protein ANN_19039 [Periplaneta americana]|uniref:Uncharacterized protein n=1 Tax=Periplaneta americana TaxID=6978 RepID=A0ABQ8SQE9_PERAM|nr:hypothetical protein ANN_19039 [Periplaneta americana]